MPDGSYFLTRYDDCLSVYRDTATWSSDKKLDFRPNFADSLLYEHHTTSLVFNDPPYHTRVRKLLAPAFTPRALRAAAGRASKSWSIGCWKKRPRKGEIDLIGDFAAAIPVAADRRHARHPAGRTRAAARLVARDPRRARTGAEPAAIRHRRFGAVADFKDYLARHHLQPRAQTAAAIRRKSSPSSSPPAILPRRIGEGERLSKLELIHNCIFLLNAGHETTTNLIGNAVDLLIRHPDAMRDLRSHPESMETAVEEFLRMESSNQLGNRRAVTDTALGGVDIAAGGYVHICIGAANRDPAQFPDPDRLDIRRQPNRHLAFGTGIHACAGMSLARMEAQVGIGRLLRRFARIEPAAAPVRGGRARFRGFTSYPVRVSA